MEMHEVSDQKKTVGKARAQSIEWRILLSSGGGLICPNYKEP